MIDLTMIYYHPLYLFFSGEYIYHEVTESLTIGKIALSHCEYNTQEHTETHYVLGKTIIIIHHHEKRSTIPRIFFRVTVITFAILFTNSKDIRRIS